MSIATHSTTPFAGQRPGTSGLRNKVTDVDIDTLVTRRIEQMDIEVIDPVADCAALMQQCFDFDAIRALFAGGFRKRLDAMSAVGGPYAKRIIEGLLGAPAGTVGSRAPAPKARPCASTSNATSPMCRATRSTRKPCSRRWPPPQTASHASLRTSGARRRAS